MAADDREGRITIDGLTLVPERWEASAGDRPLHLTRTEFSLLLLLARHPDRAFTRDELLDAVWGRGYMASSNVVDQAIAGLRRKLGDDPRHPTFIETVTGVGYRVRAGRRRRGGPRPRFPAWALVGAAAGLIAIGMAAFAAAWLLWAGETEGEGHTETVSFHATATLADPGEVTGADCSRDLTVTGAESVSRLTGDLAGEMRARSTTRLYQSTDCLSGVSESGMVFRDEDGNTLEAAGQAPVITYRLPDVPDTAVNHQNVAITVIGGSGEYAGVTGDGSCTTLSTSRLVGSDLSASSESDCVWTLRFPADDGSAQPPGEPALELSASPARLSIFGQEQGVPSQGRFLAVVRNGGDTPLKNATLHLPAPEGATIQARATCGDRDSPVCARDRVSAPPRGARAWALGEIPPGDELRLEFTMQLLHASVDTISVRLELDAAGLAQPLHSRTIEVEVVR